MEQLNVIEISDFGLRLNYDCWEIVFSYLDVEDQIDLAYASESVCKMFKEYAKRRYKHIDDDLTEKLSESSFRNLLQLIGDHVLSYAKTLVANGDIISFDDLGSYYGTLGILPSDYLDYEIPSGTEINAKKMYEMHFESIVQNCKNLEKFTFTALNLSYEVDYGSLCELPKLQHISLNCCAPWNMKFLYRLVAKQGAPLESLELKSLLITDAEMDEICKIVSLKELRADSIDITYNHFIQMRQLENLYLRHFHGTRDELCDMVFSLPRLQTLEIESISANLVRFIRTEIAKARPKLKIYLPTTEQEPYLGENLDEDLDDDLDEESD